VCDGRGRARARGEEHPYLLHRQGSAPSVWHWKRLHRGHHGPGAVLGAHKALPLPKGKVLRHIAYMEV
jgi:hypothetical protein